MFTIEEFMIIWLVVSIAVSLLLLVVLAATSVITQRQPAQDDFAAGLHKDLHGDRNTP